MVPVISATKVPRKQYTKGTKIAHLVLRIKTLPAHNPALKKTPPKIAKVQYSVNRQISNMRDVRGSRTYRYRSRDIAVYWGLRQRASKVMAKAAFYTPMEGNIH